MAGPFRGFYVIAVVGFLVPTLGFGAGVVEEFVVPPPLEIVCYFICKDDSVG